MDIINGCATALITPFLNNEVDYVALEKLIELQVQANCSIVVCGTTAETPTLSSEEYSAIIKFVVEKVDKKVPVIAGCGSNSTKSTVANAKLCENLGVDGILVVNPYYNKPTQKGLVLHFTEVANAVNIPVILYNVPGRTGSNIAPSTIAELSKVKNIVAVKEASGNISQVSEIIRLTDESFTVYSGNDDMIIPLMSLGGKGVISVLSNIMPKETRNMVDLFVNGDYISAGKEQIRLNGLVNSLFIESNPIPVKEASSILGLCSNELRLPLVNMEEANKNILLKEMTDLGLI